MHAKWTQAAQHGATKPMLRRSQHSLRKSTPLHGSDSANNRMRITKRRKTTQNLKHEAHLVDNTFR